MAYISEMVMKYKVKTILQDCRVASFMTHKWTYKITGIYQIFNYTVKWWNFIVALNKPTEYQSYQIKSQIHNLRYLESICTCITSKNQESTKSKQQASWPLQIQIQIQIQIKKKKHTQLWSTKPKNTNELKTRPH
jgi:hypothetical protein